MIFTDPFFLFVFLPVACLAFHGVGSRFGGTAALFVLLVASLLFYLPWGARMTAILAASVLVNFVVGRLLLRADLAAPSRRALLTAGELYNFGSLIWFKYHLLSNLFGRSEPELAGWAIPAGISFYTFHQAAFLADAYNREPAVTAFLGRFRTIRDKARSLIRYASFVAFFPQLVIGPITYLHEFKPQVVRRGFGRVTYLNVAVGFTFIVIGLFKKLVVADHFNGGVSVLFRDAALGVPMHPVTAWSGILAYYLQLYFDFSGYSDMALGLARLFGIRYPINFFSPFKAVGIIDYYRRWHMTLTRVISRFLYSPLSVIGTRFAARRRYPAMLARIVGIWIPLAINFEVIGLWHAATLPLILFGLLHGVWYVAETEVRRSKRWKAWRKASPDALRAAIGRVILFALMPLTFAVFRSETLSSAGFLFGQLLGGAGHPRIVGSAGVMLAAFLIVYLLPNSVEFLRRYRPGLTTYVNKSYVLERLNFAWRPDWGWMAALFAMALICLYYLTRITPFLYQGF